MNKYGEVFGHGWNKMATTPEFKVKPYLETMWVNYQNAGEYQPIHDHSGLYSFAIWFVNPVDYFPQALMKTYIFYLNKHRATCPHLFLL